MGALEAELRELGVAENALGQTKSALQAQLRKAREAAPPAKVPTVKTIEEFEETLEVVPGYLVLETDQGKRHLIHAQQAEENGFGWLDLGDVSDKARKGYQPTVARSFVQATLRSDLFNKFARGGLSLGEAQGFIGHNVVYGTHTAVGAGIKAASKTMEVSNVFMRNYDNINYMIKSFQTVLRVPFHIFNLSSGVFQAHMAGVGAKNLAAAYIDSFRMLWGNTEFIKHSDPILALLNVEGMTHVGSVREFMPRFDIIAAARRLGASEVPDDEILASLEKLGLTRVDDMLLDLGDGSQLAMSDFMKSAGAHQLYGTYASSMIRGSRTVAEQIFRLKFAALDPDKISRLGHNKLSKWIRETVEKSGGRPGEFRELSEGLNRTATALGLIRQGHPLDRAMQIARNAHVPYEKLSPFERNVTKRVSMYYTFPRHYMPFAWSKFMEDPAKLAVLTNTIKEDRLITTAEGRPTLKLGDYRIDIGRLNANAEAAMLIGAFADRIAQPMLRLGKAGQSDLYPYDPNVLTKQVTDMGLTSLGGIAGLVFGARSILPQGERAGPSSGDSWNEARRIIWPIKMGLQVAGLTASREERTPHVNYTPMEKFLTNTDLGLGIRKVRPQQEMRFAHYQYQSHLRKLRLQIAATEDPRRKQRLIENAKRLGEGLRVIMEQEREQAIEQSDLPTMPRANEALSKVPFPDIL